MTPVICILFIVISGFVWFYLSALTFSLHGSDAAGDSLGRAFAALAAIVLWILLAVLLLVAGICGQMSPWAGLAAFFLLPASGYAVQVALELMGRDRRLKWPAAVPLGVPPLVMIYSLWCVFPSFHSLIDSRVANIATWGTILILTLLPLIARLARQRALAAIPPKTPEELAAEEARRKEEYRRQRAETFHALTPDSPFLQWWDFTEEGSEFRQEAFEGARKVNNREPQIAERLAGGGQRSLVLALPKLDLQATPEIEQAVRAYLQDQVKYLMPYDPAKPMATTVVTGWFEQYFPVIQWLTSNHRTCNAELTAVAEAVKYYPDCPERQKFLNDMKSFENPGQENPSHVNT